MFENTHIALLPSTLGFRQNDDSSPRQVVGQFHPRVALVMEATEQPGFEFEGDGIRVQDSHGYFRLPALLARLHVIK